MENQDYCKIDLKEMTKFIEMIKSFDVTDSFFAYPFIKNALNEIQPPVPRYIIPKGEKLYRGRVHKNGEDFFYKISDISYNKQFFLIKNFGRANEPCQSIFYCSDNPHTAFIETCTISREDMDKDSELITWGIWNVINDIEIAYVIGHPTEITQNKMLNALTKNFVEFLRQIPEDEQKVILLFHDFISKHFQVEANGHHSLYKISCAFSNWVYNHEFINQEKNILEAAGIMYRSSIWPSEGMNIALKSNIVDSSLQLIEVRRDHIIKKGNLYDGSDTKTAELIDIENDTINWT